MSVEALEPRRLMAADPVISEFLALNSDSIVDQDGENSDWMEIHNPDTVPVNLAGWYLTDDAGDLTKWQFPSQSIAPGGFLVVFASDKNRAVAGNELHTNFKLGGEGEYLALVKPDGVTVVSAYAPNFPAQVENISYGMAFDESSLDTITLNPTSDVWLRQSQPNTNYNDDGMWISGVHDGGQQRLGAARYNLSSVTSTIIGAHLEFRAQGSGDATLAPAAWVGSGVWPGSVSPLTYSTYASTILPSQNTFTQLGSGPFTNSSPSTGSYGSTLGASAADLTALNATRTGDDVITMIFKAASGGREFSANDSYSGFNPPRLVLDVGTPASVLPGTLRYFATPTPGAANVGGVVGFAAAPAVSVGRGFYESAFNTVISSPTPGATLVYTTNGSEPTLANGTIVAPPNASTPPQATINIASTTTLRVATFKTDFAPSQVATHTYLFVADILAQSPGGQTPAGWPSSPVNGQLLDYGMDPQIVGGSNVPGDFNSDGAATEADYTILKNNWRKSVPANTLGDMDGNGTVDLRDFTLFRAAFEDGESGVMSVRQALLAIPSISMVTSLDNLFGTTNGLYVNAGQEDMERPASIELINPDGTPGFQIDAGVRIRGNFSLSDANPKHAFRLFFRGENLDYPLFGDEGPDSFEKLDLRTDQNDSWAWQGSAHETFIHDVFSRDTQRDMDQPYTRSRYYHLYIDGQYWGLYQSQERSEAYYGETYFGGEEDNYDVIKSTGGAGGYTTEATDGNLDAWFDLWTQARAGVADNAAYYKLQGLNPDGVTRNPAYPVLLDVDNLIDYMNVVFFTGDEDAPLSLPLQNNRSNNWFGVRDRTGEQGFQFFAHDAEQTLISKHNVGGLNADRTGPFTGSNQNNFLYSNPQWLHQDLMANAEYRLRFADRVQQHYFNGGALTTAATIARFEARAAEIDVAVLAESARWGDASPGYSNDPFTRADWRAAVDNIVDNYLPLRGAIVLNQLRNDGLFPTTVAPSFSQHGGTVTAGFQLSITAPAGTIYYTLDGSDPRTGSVYSGPITLGGTTTVKARALVGGAWSPLLSADFVVAAPALRVTELMYNPVAPAGNPLDKEEFEFIEIQNIGSTTVNLQGVQFTEGISFTFPNMNLAAGAYVVLASNPAAFAQKYGAGIPVVGEYGGQLNNSGEAITLTDAAGGTIQSFTFLDDDWYPSTDGAGSSLVIVNPLAATSVWSTAAGWRPSTNLGGSPGAVDPAGGGGGAAAAMVDDAEPETAYAPPAPLVAQAVTTSESANSISKEETESDRPWTIVWQQAAFTGAFGANHQGKATTPIPNSAISPARIASAALGDYAGSVRRTPTYLEAQLASFADRGSKHGDRMGRSRAAIPNAPSGLHDAALLDVLDDFNVSPPCATQRVAPDNLPKLGRNKS